MIRRQTRTALALLLGLLTCVLGVAARADSTEGGPAVHRVHGPLSVMVLGSSGPMLQASGRASAGYLVFTDGQPRVFMDLGSGTFKSLAMSGTHVAQVNYILLSHLHIDHTADLPGVIKGIYFDGREQGDPHTAPIQVYGPGTDNPMFPSTTQFMDGLFGPTGLFRYLRSFVDGADGPPALGVFGYQAHDLSPVFQGATVNTIVNENGLVIKEIAVDHLEAPAVAYRIEYKGYTIVYSGDTHSTTDNMVKLAQGADLLIYDTSILDNQPPPSSPFAKRHTTPTRMGQVAAMANPRELVLSHLTPISAPNVPLIKKIIRAQGYTGKISEAHDLKVYNVGTDD
ncbi:MAG: MBL fold metallo-hydrolase [Gammaproteobacteria bacterium]